MSALLEALTEAAQRGVAVTIITNESEPVTLRFKWRIEDKRDCAIGRFRACGLDLYVIDCDGDQSYWELRQGRDVLAEGSNIDCNPYYHFDACLLAAEAALLEHVRSRRRALARQPAQEGEGR